MQRSERNSLSEVVRDAGHGGVARWLWATDASVSLDDLARGSSLGRPLEDFRGRSVLIATSDQITAGLALIELDGIARRLVVCPSDLSFEHLQSVIATAQVGAVVTDRARPETVVPGVNCVVNCQPNITPRDVNRAVSHQTEWILLTSGTTGAPKLVEHTLATLTGAINASASGGVVWSTFYDIRRYGGLQIFLRALLGGASMVLSSARESTGDFLARAAARGVTHISGTPSHWRRVLMSPSTRKISPQYVRLSGEIADQAILDGLHFGYPDADIAHAFASTEAGVAFTVGDGLAGFPASLIEQGIKDVEMKIEDGSLRIRSARTAIRYVGSDSETIRDDDGFVDTGDMVERSGDRYYFIGRKGGIINVGGQKVHPEEVEAVINRHPSVQMSLVRARKNPITGAVVVADVVVKSGVETGAGTEALKSGILRVCHGALAPHKVPVAIRFVPPLELGASGKLARRNG